MKRILTIALLSFAIISQAQNVGIGTTTPAHPLTVYKTGIGIAQQSGILNPIKIGFYTDTANLIFGGAFLQTHTKHNLKFATNDGATQMALDTSGNFGIGTGNNKPAEKLEVNGKVIIRDTLKLPFGSPAEGKVLTSDAIGNTRWAAASGFALPYSGTVSSAQTLFALSNDAGSCATAYSPASGTYGFRGITSAGTGVEGSANSGIGISGFSNTGNAGVFQSQSGLAIKTLSGNVELNGKIKIVDGTQGADKILVSDAAGLASWVSTTAFSARKKNGNQIIPNVTTARVSFGTTSFNQSGTAYNAANSEFTAPSAGFYQFNVTLNFLPGTAGTGNPVYIGLYKNGTFFYNYLFAHTTKMGSQNFSQMVFLSAGDIVDVKVGNQSGATIEIEGSDPNYVYSSFSGYKIN